MSRHWTGGPIRVLFTTPNLMTAGGGTVLLNLFEEFDRDVVAPMLCVNTAGGSLQARIEALDVPVIERPFTVPPRPLLSLLPRTWAIAPGLAGLGVDVQHSWHYIDDYTEPLVARFAGTSRWVYSKKNMAWVDRGWRVRTALASAIVATNTDMVEDYFGSPRTRRRTVFIQLGVRAERFADQRPADLAALCGVPAGTPVVTSVARFHRGKTLEVAIRAFAATSAGHLVLAGRVDDEEYRTELEALTVELGLSDRVHMLGHVDDVPGLLAASDVFVLPSGRSAEGCPVALLEAMAAGLPCVAIDTPGSRDVVADQRTGFLVGVGDHGAMGARFVELLDDPELRARFGATGQERVRREFTVARSARAHEALYQRLVRHRSALDLLPFGRRGG